MRRLNAAQIDGDFLLQRGVDRLAEIMAQQHIFGRDGGVRFQLEQKMPVGALRRQQRLGGRLDGAVDIQAAHLDRIAHCSLTR